MTSQKTAVFKARRTRLLKIMTEGVAILPTNPEILRNGDTSFPFRADSDFHYLSGFPEPEAILVLIAGKKPRTLLFCREKNPAREIWDGFRYGPKDALSHFGFDESYDIADFKNQLPAFLKNQSTLWHRFGKTPDLDRLITQSLDRVRKEARSGAFAPTHTKDIRALLEEMRKIKDVPEIALMKTAADIASEAHLAAMKAARPGMWEYELEAELAYVFRKKGASGHSFSPIVAGGKNACTLHYIENNARLKDGDLVLIDAGCEYENYASDISRTFPVNGRFSAAQTAVYEVVLAAQLAGIAAIAPKKPFAHYHEVVLHTLIQGLKDLKLLKGSMEAILDKKTYEAFYMHRAGHWLGIDVHDVGAYQDNGTSVALAPGMVLTVEPGLYIRASAKVPERFHNIGIRIEDDVMVTNKGREVYTDVPKTVKEIESVMGARR